MINLNKKDPIADAVKEILQQEALKGNQGAIDKNHNNKVDAEDFKILRGEKKEKKKEVAEASMLDINRARDNGGEGGLGANPHHNDLHRPGKAAPSYVKQQLKARQAKGGVAGPKGSLPEHTEETVEEGIKDVAKKAFKALTGGSDKDQLDALRKRMYKPEPAKKPSDKAMGEETQLKTLRQFKENAFDWKKKQEPQPNGGSGVKQGTRYGGSKQKDKPEQDTDEKK